MELGAFQGEHLELVNGVIVEMTAIGPPHSGPVDRLTELLVSRLAGRARVRCQQPLALGELSEPEPDLAVVVSGDYDDAHPTSALLVIEVSDSSLEYDRTDKASLYAAASIADYWIVNVRERRIEVHREPKNGRYTRIEPFLPGTTVAPLAFGDVSIAVDAILR